MNEYDFFISTVPTAPTHVGLFTMETRPHLIVCFTRERHEPLLEQALMLLESEKPSA